MDPDLPVNQQHCPKAPISFPVLLTRADGTHGAWRWRTIVSVGFQTCRLFCALPPASSGFLLAVILLLRRCSLSVVKNNTLDL
jgi:hypothetical protein